VENPEGWGVIAYFKKTGKSGEEGVPSEILSVVGVWIFSATTQSTKKPI